MPRPPTRAHHSPPRSLALADPKQVHQLRQCFSTQRHLDQYVELLLLGQFGQPVADRFEHPDCAVSMCNRLHSTSIMMSALALSRPSQWFVYSELHVRSVSQKARATTTAH